MKIVISFVFVASFVISIEPQRLPVFPRYTIPPIRIPTRRLWTLPRNWTPPKTWTPPMFRIPPPTRSCHGRVLKPQCTGLKDEGKSNSTLCPRATRSRMWYYNTQRRKCVKMVYRGCGGNGNRYCSRRECRRNCRRNKNTKV